jgi:molybdate transport system substrate-binding protein
MLKVFCARSMHVAVSTLSQRFAARFGDGTAAPEIVFAPMGALQARLAAGETADVLILATPAIAALEVAGAIAAATRAKVARVPIGIAARAGAPLPDVATPEGFVAALTGARAVALSDPAVGGSAGIYLRDLFERLGIADMITTKTVRQASGVAAADAVGRGEADLALTFIPELVQGKGVRILGSLPAPYGHATSYRAALSTDCSFADMGRAFIAGLAAADAHDIWTAAGFEAGP